MNKDEMKEKAQGLTIKNVTDGKCKYYSWGYYKGCLAGLEYNNKQIADLEKENAELRARLNAINLLTPELEKVSKLRRQQLTKAKELLTKWVELFKPKGGNLPPTPIQVETENFLSEVEK